MKLSAISIAAGAILSLLAVPETFAQGSSPHSFTVQKGGTLELSVSYGDIRIEPWEKDQVVVNAGGTADSEAFSVQQDGSTIRVVEHSGLSDGSYVLSVPSRFNLKLRTAGGNVAVTSKIEGTTSVNTSAGDIQTEALQGDARLVTAGGNIHVSNVSGAAELQSSGGDIHIGNVGKGLQAGTAGGDVGIGDVGGEAKVSTAGGNIIVGKVSGRVSLATAGGDIVLKGGNGLIKATTAGGNIDMQQITGSVEASTAGGDIQASLIPSGKGKSRLSSAGGNLTLSLPENAKATIDAVIHVDDRWNKKDDQFSITSDFTAESTSRAKNGTEIKARYVINGGGESIVLETASSDIRINKLPKTP